jgi:hypothetical protein
MTIFGDGSTKIHPLTETVEGYGFKESALEAIEKWQWKPALKDGKPIDYNVEFTVDFNILY